MDGSSFFFYITPANDMALDINALASDYDTVLSVWMGTRGNLVEVSDACNDDWNDNEQSRLVVSLTSGTTYHILVAGLEGGSGSLTLYIDEIDIETVANDDFDSAETITSLPFIHVQSTPGATTAVDDPIPQNDCGSGADGHSVWFEYTPTSDLTLEINTLLSDYDTVLSVWTGTRGNLIEEDCNDDEPINDDNQSYLVLDMIAGTTYYILVTGFEDDNGGTLDLYVTPDVASDLIDQAIDFTGSAIFGHIQDSSYATLIDPSDPASNCALSVGNSVWYQIMPTEDKVIRVNLTDASFDGMLSVWEDDGSTMTEVACIGNQSLNDMTMLVPLTGGQTYYVMISDPNQVGGTFTFSAFTDIGYGDCNADTTVDAGDLSALRLEIFDGDASTSNASLNGSFEGHPLGCDANDDRAIDAGDLSCTRLIIFNLEIFCQ